MCIPENMWTPPTLPLPLQSLPKENIPIDKRTQKCLLQIKKLCSTQFSLNKEYKSTFNLIDYKLQRIIQPHNLSVNPIYSFWPHTVERLVVPPIYYEMLPNQQIYTLDYLQINPQYHIPIKSVQKSKQKAFQLNLLPLPRQKFRQIQLESYMPSKLESKMTSICEESLPKTVIFDYQGYFALKQKLLTSNTLLTARLNPISTSAGCRQKLKFTTHWPSWTIEIKTDISNISRLHKVLFDENFNKIELFKLTSCNLKVERSTSIKKKHIATWKLDKLQLKELDWDPLRKLKAYSVQKKINCDEVHAQATFTTTPLKLVLMPINSSEIHILQNNYGNIVISAKSFGNLQPKNMTESSQVSNNNTKLLKEARTTGSSMSDRSTSNTSYKCSSLVPEKRSLLDSNLISIVQLKKLRTSYPQSIESHSGEMSLLRLLHSNSGKTEIQQNDTWYDTAKLNTTPKTTSFKLEGQDIKKKVSIIANEYDISTTYQITRLLRERQYSNIEEYRMTLPCHFILSFSSCLLLVEISKVFQCITAGELFLERTLSILIKHFRVVHVFIEYEPNTELYDKDIFWKAKLILNNPQVRTIFIPKFSNNLTTWMLRVTTMQGQKFQEMVKDNTLSHFNINPYQEYLIQEKLRESSPSRLIETLVFGDHVLDGILTPIHINSLKIFARENWHLT
ncbi:hypothetical protein J6895_02418 [Nakaseomyces glabratus]|nr:hypothetical protein J6895_02418 [Nakaseomyces glabratus]